MKSPTIRNRWIAGLAAALLLIIAAPLHAQEPVGERWTATRGDGSPGVRYSSFVETPSGRWLAAGPGGQLMLSDNNGGDWRYQVITDSDGEPLFGNISDMVVFGNAVVATLVSFRQSTGENNMQTDLPFVGRTQILASSDNGDSWIVSDFPVPFALFGGVVSGVPFPGIYLNNLFVTPDGELLAYGSTAQSNGAVAFFIGGAIFRQNAGIWEQAAFELGLVQSMSVAAGGRLVASGFQSVLDSADGLLWSGYSLTESNMNLNGQALDYGTKELLNGSDIAFIGGNYVLQTQQFRRSENNENIFVVGNDRSVIFTSANPFGGARTWEGTEVSRVYPNWINMGTRLVSVFDAAFTSSGGTSWTEVDETVTPLAFSVGRAGSQGIVAVGNSDEVWNSNDAGQTWSKILDTDPGPNLRIMGRAGNVLLAIADNRIIYRSVDNGNTWVEGTNLRDQTGDTGLSPIRASGDRIYATQGEADQIITSTDQGLTWEVIPVPGSARDGLADVVIGQGGRLILAPESRAVNNPPETDFYTSDDGGQTWIPRTAPLGFGETPKQGLHVGGGRIIYLLNGFSSFDPELVTSNDNGVTWQREDPFQVIDELNRVFNDPDQRVINLRRLIQTKAGTLIILGDSSELLVSRDLGLSWEVVLNLEVTDNGDFLDWSIYDVLEFEGRLVAIVGRDASSSSPSSFRINFAYISEDEGETWRPVEIPTSESRVVFQSAVVGADGRMVISGNLGAVYVSEPLTTDPDQIQNFSVREGESLFVDVPRPPIGGDITVSYQLLPDTATEADYVPTMGQLTWLADDTTPQQVLIETVDDLFNESSETLRVEFSLTGGLILSFSYEVTITDNEGFFERGVEIVSDGLIQTSEDGSGDAFGVALKRLPTDDVTVTLSANLAGEIAFQPATLTFTPGDWNQAQQITVSGLDDNVRDRNRTVELAFATASNDPAYQDLAPDIAYVINVDNEKDELVFASSFEAQ